jgi:hypothetical protein
VQRRRAAQDVQEARLKEVPMLTAWRRTRAIVSLLVTIFSDLRRRAWWAYRTGGIHTQAPRMTIVAPRPVERHAYVPVVTDVWRAVVARALPVQGAATWMREAEVILPVAWIDVTDRPDVADLPRVLSSGRDASADRPVLGTQWLVDEAAQRTVLVVTFVEPVACTFALSFDVPRRLAVLRQIADASELCIAWEVPPRPWNENDDRSDRVITAMPDYGLRLPISRSAQLRAIVSMWAARLPAV